MTSESNVEPGSDVCCCECGKPDAASQMVSFQGHWICADCKGPYFQRVLEGGPAAPALSVAARPPGPGFGRSILLTIGFWCIAIFCSIVLGGVLLILGITGLEPDTAGSRVITFIGGVINLFAFGVVLAVGLLLERRPIAGILPFRKFDLRILVPLTLLTLGCSLLLSEADNLLQYFLPAPDFITEMMASMLNSSWASFFLLVIVAPLSEELFFRGLVLDGLRLRHSKGLAILLSSILFALFHLNPYQFMGAFVLGIIMGWLRLKTGSLWPCIFVHALNNGLVFFIIALGLTIPGYSMTPAEGVQFQGIWLNSLGVLLTLIGGGASWYLIRHNAAPPEAAIPEAG